MAAPARNKNGATQKRRKTASRSRRNTRRTRSSGRRASNGAVSRAQNLLSGAVSGDVNDLRRELGQIVSDLETRLDRLNALTRRSASHAIDGVNEFAYDTVASLTDNVRHQALSVSGDAAKMGNKALTRVSKEMDRHPLMTLALAAGIGFIAGLARRND